VELYGVLWYSVVFCGKKAHPGLQKVK
jgi:hypothetical protein